MTTIRTYLRARRIRRRRKAFDEYLRQARKRIQVLEWDGRIWLSMDGAPVLPVSVLQYPVEHILVEARAAWAAAQIDQNK